MSWGDDEASYLGDRVIIMPPHRDREIPVLAVPPGRPGERTGFEFDKIRERTYREFELKTGRREEYNI